jgi:hypothetical protein
MADYNMGTDGMTINGVPIFGSGDRQSFGTHYWVDGTNGSDNHSGLAVAKSKKTIQAAVTLQIANATGFGDVIYVLPGTYAESIVGTLTDCRLIGCGVMPTDVRVRPTASYAFHGGLIRSLVENIEFWSPSTTNPTYPAFYATYGSGAGSMNSSVINKCQFFGGNASSVVGLQIGAYASASVWEGAENSVISNCRIYGNGSANEFATGINFFAYDSTAQNTKKAARRMHIVNNTVFAHRDGIRFGVNSSNLAGTVVESNIIRGQASYGPTYGIVCSYAVGSGDQTAMVINNRICAVTDAISGFKTNLVQGNIVSLGANAPASETGQ